MVYTVMNGSDSGSWLDAILSVKVVEQESEERQGYSMSVSPRKNKNM